MTCSMKMNKSDMKLYLLFILTFIVNLCLGQNFKNDSLINLSIKNLLENDVDTIIVYVQGCLGCDEPIILLEGDSCFFYYGEPEVSYILWRKHGEDYILKLSTHDCYDYLTLNFDLNPIWNLYFNNKAKIKNEPLLPPSYIEGNDTLINLIDHYSYSQFKIIVKSETIEFENNKYYLNELIIDKFRNINYDYNKHNIRIQLQKLIDEKIKLIESKNLIKRKKRLTTMHNKT